MRTMLLIASVLALGPHASRASTVSELDPGTQVTFPAVAIGADGFGLVAYVANGNALRVAHCSNAACTAATISTLGPVGPGAGSVSLAIGTDGRGLVAYYDTASPEALRVAHCNDQACTSATATAIDFGWVRGQTAIAIGTDGLPVSVRRTTWGDRTYSGQWCGGGVFRPGLRRGAAEAWRVLRPIAWGAVRQADGAGGSVVGRGRP